MEEYHSIFNLLPFSVYWKDTEGRYLGRNRYAAEAMVFHQHEASFDIDYVNMKTDYDLFDLETAELYRKNDLITLSQPDIIHHFTEELKLASGKSFDQVSVKRCILGYNSDPIGILSFTLNYHKFTQPDLSLEELVKDDNLKKLRKLVITYMASKTSEEYQDLCDLLLSTVTIYPQNHELRKILLLTRRELQCLCLMLKCLSSKQIGLILNVSYRTVEVHLANIKEKLYCPFRLEVIDWFWNLLSEL